MARPAKARRAAAAVNLRCVIGVFPAELNFVLRGNSCQSWISTLSADALPILLLQVRNPAVQSTVAPDELIANASDLGP